MRTFKDHFSMKMLYLVFGIFLCCVPLETYRTRSLKWLGMSVDNLVLSWGPPQSSFTLKDNSSVIQFRFEWDDRDLIYDFSMNNYFTQTNRRVCKVNFFVNSNRIVQDVAFEGDCDRPVAQ